MNPALITLAIQEAPAVIAALRSLFQKANPNAPLLTDAEVIAAYQVAFTSSLAKDDTWLATHRQP